MLIKLKSKNTLIIDNFKFKCCIGKKGIRKNKIEGDKATPRGSFKLIKLYYRKDRVDIPLTKIKSKAITPELGWCDDPKSQFYNKEIKVNNKIKHEKLFRSDHRYDYILNIDHNKKNTPYKGSAIFIHLTPNYKPTAGCVALKKSDFEVLLKIINKKSKIKIF